jgi:hypothetical protein
MIEILDLRSEVFFNHRLVGVVEAWYTVDQRTLVLTLSQMAAQPDQAAFLFGDLGRRYS